MRKRQMFSEIAYASVLTAITLLFIYVAGIAPGGRLALLGVSTAVGAFVLMDTHFRFWLSHYTAASLLGMFVSPNILTVLPYVFIFGNYAAVKYAIECIKSRVPEYIVKSLYFAGMGYITYLVCHETLFKREIAWYAVLTAAIVAGLLFDYLLTLVIGVYNKRIRNWIRR